LRTEPGIAAVTPPSYLGGTAVVTVIPTTSPEAAATSDLITRPGRLAWEAAVRRCG